MKTKRKIGGRPRSRRPIKKKRESSVRSPKLAGNLRDSINRENIADKEAAILITGVYLKKNFDKKTYRMIVHYYTGILNILEDYLPEYKLIKSLNSFKKSIEGFMNEISDEYPDYRSFVNFLLLNYLSEITTKKEANDILPFCKKIIESFVIPAYNYNEYPKSEKIKDIETLNFLARSFNVITHDVENVRNRNKDLRGIQNEIMVGKTQMDKWNAISRFFKIYIPSLPTKSFLKDVDTSINIGSSILDEFGEDSSDYDDDSSDYDEDLSSGDFSGRSSLGNKSKRTPQSDSLSSRRTKRGSKRTKKGSKKTKSKSSDTDDDIPRKRLTKKYHSPYDRLSSIDDSPESSDRDDDTPRKKYHSPYDRLSSIEDSPESSDSRDLHISPRKVLTPKPSSRKTIYLPPRDTSIDIVSPEKGDGTLDTITERFNRYFPKKKEPSPKKKQPSPKKVKKRTKKKKKSKRKQSTYSPIIFPESTYIIR